MKYEIKRLNPDITTAYLDFFDNKAFSDGNPNGPCYCTSPNMNAATEQKMVSEFGNGVKETVRRYATQMLANQKIHGYLAFDGDSPIGWCNAGDIDSYARWIPEYSRQNAVGKTVSVVCLCIAPEYRGMGVSFALLQRVIADAKKDGYSAVEGYAKILKDRDNYDFTGPARLFEKAGFITVAKYEDNGERMIMRKILYSAERDKLTVGEYNKGGIVQTPYENTIPKVEHKITRLAPEYYCKCANIWNMDNKPEMVQKWYNELVSGNRIIFVYTENDEFIGEGALVFENGDPDYTIKGKRIYLSRMIVKLERRNHGIGGIILDYLVNYARQLGYTEISLGVDKANVSAWQLYKKKGFDTVIFDGEDEHGAYVKLLKRLD